jgi:NHLM bacteriocin system ABC transporter peptidase/ATP-binding protein
VTVSSYSPAKEIKGNHYRRVKTPTILQMEAVECGAASLAMILAYYGRFVPLEKLRMDCGISRDGSKASNLVRAAKGYGLTAQGYRLEPDDFDTVELPVIVFWNFNHFVVVEGVEKEGFYLNDPATGPRRVSTEEFNKSFTGVVLSFDPGPDFRKGGSSPNILKSLAARLEGSRVALAYVLLASLFLVAPGLIIPVFSKIFVDDILVGSMKSWIFPLLWGMALTAALRGVLTWMQQYFLLYTERKFAVTSSTTFFWHVLRLPIEFFTQRYPGDIAGRVAINDQISNLLSGQFTTNVINMFMIVFYAVVMFQYDILLTCVGIFMALANFVVLKNISRNRININKKLQQEEGKLLGTTMDGLMTIETLKATGSESDFFAKWAGYQAKVITSQQQLGLPNQVLTVVPVLLMSITNAAILTLGGFRVMDGHLTVGMLVAFQSLMISFLGPVNQLVSLGGVIQTTEANLNRLDDVLKYELDEAFQSTENIAAPEGAAVKLTGELKMIDVTFGYSRLEPPLIENFNLSLLPGTRVALIGGSGSGKSTIAKVVSGLYKPWSGDILFDGKPRANLHPAALSNSVAMVDQDIFIFEGTIKENLTLWDTTIPDRKITFAAKDACIHDDIAARTGAYNCVVEEGGRNFSGGQCQRMEIARALVTDPTILILDEATSSLDPKTEMMIDANLRRRGCTCLIVAHRLSTIRDCDEIIVLDQGKVAQRGTHEELLGVDGLYKDLIKQN